MSKVKHKTITISPEVEAKLDELVKITSGKVNHSKMISELICREYLRRKRGEEV